MEQHLPRSASAARRARRPATPGDRPGCGGTWTAPRPRSPAAPGRAPPRPAPPAAPAGGCAPPGRARSRGRASPITARSTSRSECASACVAKVERAAEAAAVGAHLGERLRVARRRGTRAPATCWRTSRAAAGSRCWGSPGARADGGCAPPRAIPSDCRAAGREPVRSSSAGPNAPSSARIARIVDQRLHARPDGGEEIGDEIRIGVDRVLDRPGGRDGSCARRCARPSPAPVPACRTADSRRRPGTRSPRAPCSPALFSAWRLAVGERYFSRSLSEPGCAAAPDALAMRVEQHHFHAASRRSAPASRRSSGAAARSGSSRRSGRHSGRNRSSRTASASRPVCCR